MELQSYIKRLAHNIHEEVISLRRYFHQHPHLSFEEGPTAMYVKNRLLELGIPVQAEIGGHGLVGFIEGRKGPGKVIALRADMDALPIQEENEVSYKSQHPGIMHACGHDAHTASLLGTAHILHTLSDHFAGGIKLIFQPAEERLPGGASLMIKDGVLHNPTVSAILGQHVQPYLDAGKIGIRSGAYMASCDEIFLRVIGKGGHAAQPGDLIDPVAITAQIINSLQQVISRSDPRKPGVLSIGKVIANGATNIIPDEVYLEGTFRAMDEGWRRQALEQIRRIIEGTASALGARVDLDLKIGYPVLFNEENLTSRIRGYISEYVGEENVIDLDIWMAAEDFSYYTQEIPGSFYRLGTRNEQRGIVHGLHTSRFDIDEEALSLSTGLMAWLALQELGA